MMLIKKWLCRLFGHTSRSVGYSINEGPNHDQMSDLQQCKRCIKAWKVPISTLEASDFHYKLKQKRLTNIKH